MSRYPRAAAAPTPHLPRKAYRVNEAQYMLGVGRSKIYRLVQEGVLKSVKLNGVNLITADSIDVMLQGDAA